MNNPARGIVSVELDRKRSFRLTMNDFVEFEELEGKKLAKAMQDGFSMKELRTVLYLGFRHEDNELTPEMVGDMIGLFDIKDLMAKIFGTSSAGEEKKA